MLAIVKINGQDLLPGVSVMKFYYALGILVQLLLVVPTGNKNKISYLLYLWDNSLFNKDGSPPKKQSKPQFDPPCWKTKTNTTGDKYSLFLER
jgi:hypothetical protein